MAAADAMKRADIKPVVLEAKESISLINGTQAMLAVGLLTICRWRFWPTLPMLIGSVNAGRSQGNGRRVR